MSRERKWEQGEGSGAPGGAERAGRGAGGQQVRGLGDELEGLIERVTFLRRDGQRERGP